jgi:hypothetical protein
MVFIVKGAGWSIHAQRLFLGFVAFSLVAPLVQTLYPIFGKSIVAPVEERRVPNPFPPLRLLMGVNGDFSAELNEWFDDRVGFRDLFIRTKNQIDYTVFDTSRKVWIGSDGWLFAHVNPRNRNGLDAAQLAILEDGFLALARQLQDKGIHLLVIGYPPKSTIYPEMAPPQMPKPPAENYERLRTFLAGRSEFAFIDAEAIMKREKAHSSEHLYYKTDMHATEVAQLPIVQEIVARIAQIENRPDVRWDEKFTLRHEQQWNSGGWARMMPLLTPPAAEEIPYFSGKYTIGDAEPDGRWTIPDHVVFEYADAGIGRPFDFEFRSRPELCASRLPGMVLFGNSFSDLYWGLGLQRYFCFIRRARDPVSRFKAFYETMPADTKYFIFEYYEPALPDDVELFKQLLAAN